jgi:hypothetical protein
MLMHVQSQIHITHLIESAKQSTLLIVLQHSFLPDCCCSCAAVTLQLMAVKTIKVLGAAGAEQQTHLKRLQAEIDLMKDLRSPYIVGKCNTIRAVYPVGIVSSSQK